MENNKMNWFKVCYENGSLEYAIKKSGEMFGAICEPTGNGKSGRAYEDMVYRINKYMATNKKLILNISAPILKLANQFVLDFLSALSLIYGTDVLSKFMLVLNSSDNTRNYSDLANDLGINICSLKDIESKCLGNNNIQFVIMSSCHKSLDKFIKRIGTIKEKADIINYIDESHLISLTNETDSDSVKVNLTKLCANSNGVFCFSATHDKDVLNCVNRWRTSNEKGRSLYIHHVRPKDAILKGNILAPYIKFDLVDEEFAYTAPMLIKAMKKFKADNDKIKHKVLVTCDRKGQIVDLARDLSECGYKVFYTYSGEGGMRIEDENGNLIKDEETIMRFIKEVEDCKEDCFVLHIRQLIAGIDIKGLTDCIYFSKSAFTSEKGRTMIQIIGRTLRPLKGERGTELEERGLTKKDRLKPYGGVLILFVESEVDSKNEIETFLTRYYGIGNKIFEKNGNIGGGKELAFYEAELIDDIDDTYHDRELLINIENYIKTELLAQKKFITECGLNYEIEIKTEINKLLAKYDAFGKEFDTLELFDTSYLMDDIAKLFEKYGI